MARLLHSQFSAIRSLFKGFVAFTVLMGLTSCAQHYRLATPADISELPFRRGMAGFNVVGTTPWRYLGSRYQVHEFRYYYNREDALQYREVAVARDRTVLNFEEMPYGRVQKWVTLRTDGEMFHFSLLELR